MTLDEYWDTVNQTFRAYLWRDNKWRWGQTCMNVLWVMRPDIYDKVKVMGADVWNEHVSSPTYDAFVRLLYSEW